MDKKKIESIDELVVGEEYEIAERSNNPYFYVGKSREGILVLQDNVNTACRWKFENNTFYHIPKPEPHIKDYIGKWVMIEKPRLIVQLNERREVEGINELTSGRLSHWYTASCIKQKLDSGEWKIADDPKDFFDD